MAGFQVAICGASGAVGVEIVNCLHKRNFPVSRVRLFTSPRSAGKTTSTPYGPLQYELFSVEAAREADIVFLAVDGTFAKTHAAALSEGNGPIVIDNSSAFRYHDEVPLVVPEINAHAIGDAKIIANPNCTTAVAAMALWPLHRQYKIEKLIISTYQAASGAGQPGIDELEAGLRQWAGGEAVTNEKFVHPLPFNVLPHIDVFRDDGYTKEEWKVLAETQKIFGDPGIKVSCTAVRVPTRRAHAEAITAVFGLDVTPDEARATMATGTGVEVVDSVGDNAYPMPLNASGKDDVEVGRVRQSSVFGSRGLDLFVCGDQLLRGAALNAVLIAEAAVLEEFAGLRKKHTLPYKKKLLARYATYGAVAAVVAATAMEYLRR
eukprot:CAMPEP_0118862266 /NCGR_PEP_ID=MMETSP1163-20130328/7527_1 /TAXON_ID=124430 /ORGANISM="Phaeomonas parva, Strain CCMP2877" /LENGTH=376 /DNA_ID=CAMNT_0006796153 /DNA_START=148 /DNA_END=1278 /DNA_ORIENTATION=+